MAKSPRDNGDLTRVREWARKLLIRNGISAEECFAAFAGYGIKVMTERSVIANLKIIKNYNTINQSTKFSDKRFILNVVKAPQHPAEGRHPYHASLVVE